MSERDWPQEPSDDQEPRHPGQSAIAMTGLLVGLVMMGIQLWLLTLAFDLYLSGERGATLLAAGCSGLIFLGGLFVLRLVGSRTGR